MNNKELAFYFDYLSPYAYFGWINAVSFCAKNQLTLVPKPVVFGKLLDHWGQLGPAEIPPKRQWLGKYCLRYAAKHGIPLAFPKYHPFNSLTALRLSLADVSGSHQCDIITALFEAGWGQGMDIGDDQEIEQLLNARGLPGTELIAKTKSEPAKNSLKAATAAAIDRGVFGIPTLIIDDELFWGNDQFEFIEDFIQGREHFDATSAEALSPKGRAIDRKAFLNRQENNNL